jgi:hypothetical protein
MGAGELPGVAEAYREPPIEACVGIHQLHQYSPWMGHFEV